jgi:hypothetical protein
MKRIMIFILINLNLCAFWLTSTEEEAVCLFNFNGDGSWINIQKIEVYPPIFSENGREVFTEIEKSYYDIMINFEDLLKNREINEISSIRISNENSEKRENFPVKFNPNTLTITIPRDEDALKLIEFMKRSKFITLLFYDAQGRRVLQKFNIDELISSMDKIVPKKTMMLNSTVPLLSHEIISPEEYMEKFIEIYDSNVAEFQNNFTINFKIKNKGQKVIKHMDVFFYFKDENGKTIHTTKLTPIFQGSLYGDLKENSTYKLKDNDYFFDNGIPTNWRSYEIKIENIQF